MTQPYLHQYAIGDDPFDVYVAPPAEPGPRPSVLVCHAWGGRDEFAEDKARKLSELGYVGAAVDVYGVGQRGDGPTSSAALMTPLIEQPQRLRERLLAAYEQVRQLPEVDSGAVSCIGYCFGGLCSLLLARMEVGLKSATSFHGLLKLGQPLGDRVSAKVQIFHGQEDPMVPPQDVANFLEELRRTGADYQFNAYPGLVHAFTNPQAQDRAAGMQFDATAAERAWRDMTRLLSDTFR